MLIHVGNAVNHTGLSLPVVFHLVIYSIIVVIIIMIMCQCKLDDRGRFNFSG